MCKDGSFKELKIQTASIRNFENYFIKVEHFIKALNISSCRRRRRRMKNSTNQTNNSIENSIYEIHTMNSAFLFFFRTMHSINPICATVNRSQNTICKSGCICYSFGVAIEFQFINELFTFAYSVRIDDL